LPPVDPAIFFVIVQVVTVIVIFVTVIVILYFVTTGIKEVISPTERASNIGGIRETIRAFHG
jgi:hypothetical protein